MPMQSGRRWSGQQRPVALQHVRRKVRCELEVHCTSRLSMQLESPGTRAGGGGDLGLPRAENKRTCPTLVSTETSTRVRSGAIFVGNAYHRRSRPQEVAVTVSLNTSAPALLKQNCNNIENNSGTVSNVHHALGKYPWQHT